MTLLLISQRLDELIVKYMKSESPTEKEELNKKIEDLRGQLHNALSRQKEKAA